MCAEVGTGFRGQSVRLEAGQWCRERGREGERGGGGGDLGEVGGIKVI